MNQNHPTHPLVCMLAASSVAAVLGCSPGTGGREVELGFQLESSGSVALETATGWSLELTEAYAAVGPVFIYENAPPLAPSSPGASADARSWMGLIDAFVGTAHAHPGHAHFSGGVVKGEWLSQHALSLLESADRPRFAIPGLAGVGRSLTIHLEPPHGSTTGDADALHGFHAYVVGTATRTTSTDDGEQEVLVVPFEGGLTIPAEGDQRQVQGVPVTGSLDDGAVLHLAMNVEAWFQEANFERLLDGVPNERGNYVIDEASQVHNAWYIGIRSVTLGGGVSSFSAHIEGSP